MYLPLSSKTIIHLKINWKVARLNKMPPMGCHLPFDFYVVSG